MLNLKKIRKSRGITQVKVSEDLNIHRSTYNGYEQGISEPNIETIKRFVDYFGCSFEEILGIEKKTSSTTSPTKQRALDIFNQLADNDYLVLIGYMEHLLLEKEQKRKQRINTIIEDINRGE